MILPLVILLALTAGPASDQPVAIGAESQLFLDDFTVSRMVGVRRVLHQPVKRGVILGEHGEDFGLGGVFHGNIVARDRTGRFHMLYRFPWDDPTVSRFTSIGPEGTLVSRSGGVCLQR